MVGEGKGKRIPNATLAPAAEKEEGGKCFEGPRQRETLARTLAFKSLGMPYRPLLQTQKKGEIIPSANGFKNPWQFSSHQIVV